MYNYIKEIDFLNNVEKKYDKQSQRHKLTEDEISDIKNKYKNIPEDYFDYLRYIGWGDFRNCQFMVYESPLLYSEIFEESEIGKKNNYVFFGDNFAGDLSGFNIKNGKVVEWWQETDEIHEVGKTFKEYIRKKMLMDENGNDIRGK